MSQASQPYPSGSSASAWTTWSYDGLGRTVSVKQPDGASTTTYAYSGTQTTVTDPAGKWKQYTKDVLGNLTMVVEPDPNNQPGGTLTSSYTYDWMNHVTQVAMTRGSTTQYRTFVYDNAGRLTSATNPENWLVTYTYNSDNTLQDKHDAKGQDTVYTYDSLKRVTMVQRYPNGKNNAEDTCARVTYSYDTNPYSSTFSQYTTGRLTAALYPVCAANASGNTPVTEMYSYHPAGAVTAKQLQTPMVGYNQYNQPVSGTALLNLAYTYGSAGQVSSMSYGTQANGTGSPGTTTFTYGYDAMDRPVSLSDSTGKTWVENVQYDYVGRPDSMDYFAGFYYTGSGLVPLYTQETMSYNVNGQLASLNWGNAGSGVNGSYTWAYPSVGGLAGGVQYSYSATQNNGQITQVSDTLSGETISYQYDALKRLTSASSTPISGSTPTAWTQTYQYDGFGNLTAKVLNGTSTPIPVNPANNGLTNANYDGNGNMVTGLGAGFTYDEANRITSATETSGGVEYYGYAPDNKQIYTQPASGPAYWTLYGARGEKLGTYTISPIEYTSSPVTFSFVPGAPNVWFAGKLISKGGVSGTFRDRLGTDRATGARFRPFGDEITSTGNDFATYTNDSYTGLGYADQRFYASSYGRFNTADQYRANKGGPGNPKDPGSWNRFAYTRGDPVNRFDPRGTCDQTTYSIDADGNFVVNCTDYSYWSWGDPFEGFWESMTSPGAPNSSPSLGYACVMGFIPGCGIAAYQSYLATQQAIGAACTQPAHPGVGNDQIQNMINQTQQVLSSAILSGNDNPLATVLGFLSAQFWPGGPWDYKHNFTPGTTDFQNAQNFGNYAFGAVMESLGLTYTQSQQVAGGAQILIWMAGGAQGISWPGGQWPYGDQPQDAQEVLQGYTYEGLMAGNLCSQ